MHAIDITEKYLIQRPLIKMALLTKDWTSDDMSICLDFRYYCA
jgi:hypothetical protein